MPTHSCVLLVCHMPQYLPGSIFIELRSNNPPRFTCLPRVRHLHLIELKTFVLISLGYLAMPVHIYIHTHTRVSKCLS